MVAAASLLGGCLSRGGNIPYDPKDFGPPDTSTAPDQTEFPVGPLDTVKITVFRVADLSGDYQVDGRGFLDLPLIGQVKARDLTTAELAHALEAAYGARYLNNPDISVRILAGNVASVTVEGGVTSPGIFPLTGKTTLLGAVALGKGINQYDGNPRRVMIFRKREGKTMAATFDIIAIRRGEMDNPDVYPGDTVVVDSSLTRGIYRDLLQTLPAITVFSQL